MADPELVEQLFTGNESLSVDDSFKFKQAINMMMQEGKVHALKDIEGSFTVRKLFNQVRGASLSVSTPGLEETDGRSKAVQKTPWRVSLDSMKRMVTSVEYIKPEMLPTMNICVIKLANGFVLVGKSAPADPENYNEQLGQEYAYEDALRQMWPLEAYVMREYLSGGVEIHDPNGRWA